MEHVSKAVMKCNQWGERAGEVIKALSTTRLSNFTVSDELLKLQSLLVVWPLTSLRLAPVTPSLRSMSVPSDLQRGRMWLLLVTLMIRWAAMAGTYRSIRSLAALHLEGKQTKDLRAGEPPASYKHIYIQSHPERLPKAALDEED